MADRQPVALSHRRRTVQPCLSAMVRPPSDVRHAYGCGVATTFHVRPQPCTGCRGKIIIVESRQSGLGGLLRLKQQMAVQHADFEPGLGDTDRVDDQCRREPE